MNISTMQTFDHLSTIYNKFIVLLIFFKNIVMLIISILSQLFCDILTVLDRKRIILDRIENEPYLERYYVFLKDRPDWFPFNIFIHKFLKSDPDDFHDHPWGFATLILAGGYWENIIVNEGTSDQKTQTIWRPPGYFHVVSAEYQHRVEVDPDKPCWTLFIPFKRVREWGFFVSEDKTSAMKKQSELLPTKTQPETVWMSADDYLEMRRKDSQNKKK